MRFMARVSFCQTLPGAIYWRDVAENQRDQNLRRRAHLSNEQPENLGDAKDLVGQLKAPCIDFRRKRGIMLTGVGVIQQQ